MSGMGFFEVLAAAPDEEQERQREANDHLAAAIYDVRAEFGDFLFQANNVREYRDRCALIKDDAIKVVGRHLMPITSTMRHIGLTGTNGHLEKEFRQHLATRIAGEDHTQGTRPGSPAHAWGEQRNLIDRAHSGDQDAIGEIQSLDPRSWVRQKYEREREGSRHQADMTGPDMNIKDTFQDHQGEELDPEGNFHGYLDSVDQGAPSKVDGDFVDRGDTTRHDGDPANTDFKEAGVVREYAAFCRENRIPLTLEALERHGRRLSPGDYLKIATSLQAAGVDKGKTLTGSWVYQAKTANQRRQRSNYLAWCRRNRRTASVEEYRRFVHAVRTKTAAPDYLQKAFDALSGLLNQRAEEFQEQVAPINQAYQVVQQALALQQQQNPLGVTPPAGTVNVMPGGGGAAPGGDQSAPPPAVGADGAGGGGDPTMDAVQTLAQSGMPADGMPPQQVAAGKRGGRPKARGVA